MSHEPKKIKNVKPKKIANIDLEGIIKPKRQYVSLEMQALVIFLRFGSLNSDEKIWMRPTEVLKRTKVSMKTQWSIIKRWKERGFLIMRPKREGPKEMLNNDQLDWLTSPETLNEMSHLSLRKRAEMVKAKFGMSKFNHKTLRSYYLKYQVKFKRPDYKYYRTIAENEELKEKQMVFVKHLATAMLEKAYDEILYMDETSVHVWHRATRCWVRPGMKMTMIRG